jgi:phosphoribosylformylglycinamidine cyclo-ligase
MQSNYKSAGVDIQAGEETVSRIRSHVKSTFNKNVLRDIGHFGAFYEIPLSDFKEPVLVSSVDGVGTKLKIAFAMNRHDTVGQDLVNHCVNDIAVCGANPLYFMDYLAFGKLYPVVAEKIIEGFSVACRQNGCALIGGETAEMPGIYSPDEYDMSGTIVGIVEKSKIIDGRDIKIGDVLIGFPSNGLHTNGYSLARKVLLEKFSLTEQPDGLSSPLGEELLKVHKSYLNLIKKLKENIEIKGFSHITGGGIIGNTKRIIPKGLKLNIDWKSWEWPTIFKLIQKAGVITVEEMREVFNLGIGLIAVVNGSNAEKVIKISKELNEIPIVLGGVVKQ